MAERLPSNALLYLPLGGAGEIGMNLSLYGHGGKWLMVDLGVTFADETMPGIDLLTPDHSWIADRREDLVGLVLTHAHEDHLGAVPYLWRDLECPVYATPFTASVLRRKLAEVGLEHAVPIRSYDSGDTLELGPFRVRAISITHSIPEAQTLAIETPAGLVVHTGDWKIDPNPLVGPLTDATTLAALGDRNVLALICDSTNVFRHGESGSEAAVRNSLYELLKDRRGRIAVTTFASNIARVESIAVVAERLGRHVCLIGRSLWRYTEAARENGYLRDLPPFLTERDVGYLPADRTLLICTGCQGEPRGAMSRIAAGDHPHVSLGRHDVAVFSSRIIPGNERSLGELHNKLALAEIEVVTERDAFVHVSGHPARDELAQMYRWIRPHIAVPVHGEARHLVEHAKLARGLRVPEAVVIRNGQVLQLAPDGPRIIDEVPSGRFAVDGDRLVPPQGPLLQARRRLMRNGVVAATVVLDSEGRMAADPRLALQGVADDGDGVIAEAARAALAAAIERLPRGALADDQAVTEAGRQAVRRAVRNACERHPVVEIQIVRLTEPAATARRRGKEVAV